MKRTLISLLLVAFAAHIIYYVTKRYLEHRADATFGRRHRCQPPPELPYRWPLGLDRIKELWDSNSEGRLLAFLCSIAKDYEPRNNLSQYLLVGPRAFHILHPRNVESLLSTNFTDYGFGVRRDVFRPLLGNGIFAQEGPAWKHSRELLRKQFIRTQYQNLDHFREHVDNLITHLPVNGIIDLQPLFFNLTLDTTTALLLGRSVYSLRADIDQDNENRLFAESFSIAQEGLAKRFRIAPWHFFYNPPKFRRACSNVHRFVERYIRERNLQNEKTPFGEESYGFIDQVAKESVSNEDLRDQLLNVLLAGRDTTACCLSWTFRLLVRHHHIMDRLRREISSVMGESEHPSREQIRRMPFLACVIKESLRLYPPVPLNNRTATKTTILPTGGGPDGHSPILVRRGELVVFSQYVNSRMRSIFGPDADDFRPERWEGSGLSGIGWAYFPFSGGPRQCLGEDFALMEVSYTVVRLLQASSLITLPSGEKIVPVGAERQRLTLVLSSEDGCRVKIERR
ncbi:probable cytochrome P450 alkane hydroxylase [Phialocephala subalpina]|uniref:Probable cytochrome P450 alkane hydroxylase n=1 Tax=Phialocephala subalpina TaxID=576137 RepID=A0A1L7WU31_9HELO|nr:probable cytochrome P450 alkane hydroxylase [Phialocephala subalpina]